MGRTRVAILGGGMAGLTCAYELSRTEELRQKYEVTVHQMGWRLGGKAASGRDRYGRNLEHGLHVWFGYYDNAFRLLREAYAAQRPAPDCPLQTWKDAFKPQQHTGIGVLNGSKWEYVFVDWPEEDGEPGDPGKTPHVLETFVHACRLAARLLDQVPQARGARALAADALDRARFLDAVNEGRSAGEPHSASWLAEVSHLSPSHAFQVLTHWLEALPRQLTHARDFHIHAIMQFIVELDHTVVHHDWLESKDATQKLIAETIHVFIAAMRGAVKDLLLPNRPFEAIDDQDFRQWLVSHGARPDIVDSSSIVRVVYDISFQYTDGYLDQPDCAAGSAMGSIVRMLATYRGSMLYLAQAGFGEAVITPIYRTLLDQGVRFEFFHKVTGLELSADKRRVERVRFNRQADIVDAAPYAPTIDLDGLTCWPSEPLWEQLVNGDALKAAGVDFESRWCTQPPAGEETLHLGQDYDHVVLAIALGGYKPLTDESGEHDPGICRELAEANPRFARFLTIPLSPTLALQIWSDRSLAELGWRTGQCATVSGPQLFNIWADMSQVLAMEPGGPRSLHYLCGGYPTKLYAASPSRSDVPAQAEAEARAIARQWLNDSAGALWPKAMGESGFDWNVLSDPEGRTGEHRFEAQFWRANIEPTECCVASATGTTTHRLLPHESGFDNLTLTGEGTRHGLNATAVEAAVMSGIAASRAVQGLSYDDVPGFDFLRRRPWGSNGGD